VSRRLPVKASGPQTNHRNDRFTPENRSDYRTPGQVDRDRILYSTAFARLAEVTQVVSPDHGHVFHNRLTHSLKVSQLARKLAEKLSKEQPTEVEALGGLDPDVAEAAGLAHDLGHPPFGHIAEETLQRLTKRRLKDSFEGNAQSFRIVSKLAVGDAIAGTGRQRKGSPSLNLTRATLNGLLKYPWVFSGNPAKKKKWGAYQSEEAVFQWARQHQPFGKLVKSVEAELMDWADDITFAIHDLIDFFRAGRIPLERFADDGARGERESFCEEVFSRCPELRHRRSDFEDAFDGIVEMFSIDRRYTGAEKERRHICQLGTVLISRFVDCIKLTDTAPQSPVKIAGYAKDEIWVLKELTWHYVIVHNSLAVGQRGQQKIIEDLFEILAEAAVHKNEWKLFPIDQQENLHSAASDASLIRVVVDYIASMTEKEAISTHRLMTGTTVAF
jgi:dGTPase